MSGIADPFNGHIDEFRIAHVQRSDGWIETTWNNMSDPGAFAAAAAEEQQGGELPPLPPHRVRTNERCGPCLGGVIRRQTLGDPFLTTLGATWNDTKSAST